MSDSLTESLITLSLTGLNSNQKKSIITIATSSIKNYTFLANLLTQKFNFSLSTSWNITRSLKNLGLICDNKSQRIILTKLGNILFQEIKNDP
jgi:hypothetical protein